MSSFTKPLILTPLPDGERWRLVEEFNYYVGEENSNEIIRVPAGFITDFASVPRFFWRIIPPWGKYGKASIIHDYCYAYALYPRKRCDEIFYEAMGILGVVQWQRWIMYKATRMFGWMGWNEHRKRDATDITRRKRGELG